MKRYNDYTGTTLNLEVASFLGISMKFPSYQPLFKHIPAPNELDNMPAGFEVFIIQVDFDTIRLGDIYYVLDSNMVPQYGRLISIEDNQITLAANDQKSVAKLDSSKAIFQVITTKGLSIKLSAAQFEMNNVRSLIAA